MKIEENKNDLIGTYISGAAYTGGLAIFLLLLCFLIDSSWFDYTITYAIIVTICVAFFISGFKKVGLKNLGIIVEFGRPNFDLYLKPGLYWILPFHKLIQNSGFRISSEKEELRDLVFFTRDRIPFQIDVEYYWKIIDPKLVFENDQPSLIKSALTSAISKFIQEKKYEEIISNMEKTNLELKSFISEIGTEMGIELKLFPVIKVKDDHQAKYERLDYEIEVMSRRLEPERKHKDESYRIEEKHKSMEHAMIIQIAKELNISSENSFNLLKLYMIIRNLTSNF